MARHGITRHVGASGVLREERRGFSTIRARPDNGEGAFPLL
jgi:hypothetical protein